MIATVSSSRSPSVDIPRVAPDRMTASGAAGLAAQINSGDLSVTEVVEAHIARIEQVDTTLQRGRRPALR